MLQLTTKLMNMFSYSITIQFSLVKNITIPIIILIQFIKFTLSVTGLTLM